MFRNKPMLSLFASFDSMGRTFCKTAKPNSSWRGSFGKSFFQSDQLPGLEATIQASLIMLLSSTAKGQTRCATRTLTLLGPPPMERDQTLVLTARCFSFFGGESLLTTSHIRKNLIQIWFDGALIQELVRKVCA